MTKKFINLALMCMLATSSLSAKTLFDLKAQDFEHTLGDKYINGKYKVDDNILTETNLGKSGRGFYFSKDGTFGHFNIILNKPIDKFTLNFNLIYDTSYGSARFIKLSDINGKIMLITFDKDGFVINGSKFKATIDDQSILLNIVKNASSLIVSINGNTLYNEKYDFTILSSVDLSLYQHNYGNVYDQLNDIKIIENE